MRNPLPSSLRRRAQIAKAALLWVRSLNFIFSASISAVFITLLSRPAPEPLSPKPEIGVLLSFTLITALQSIISAVLTFINHEKLWVAAIDLVCICGYVCAAVLLRGITSSYNCATWLEGGEGHTTDGTLMRRAHGAEAGECAPLRGVFGVAIVGCFLLLASFQLALYTVKARKQIASEDAKTASKLEMGDLPEKPRKSSKPKSKSGAGSDTSRKLPAKPHRTKSDAVSNKVPEKPRQAKIRPTSAGSEERAFVKPRA